MTPQEDGMFPKRTASECTPCEDCASPLLGPHVLEHELIRRKLAELDAEETVAMEPIRRRRLELKRLWNSSLPIHKLSGDVLVRIFVHFPHTPKKRPRAQYVNGRPVWLDLGWPSLMLVCHHWRALLVSTPTFWWRVNVLRRPSWTKLCLSRSVPGPVNVYLGGDFNPSRLDDIRPHAHRYKTFQYSDQFGDAALIEALAPLFDGGMPLLESLQFTVNASSSSKTKPVDVQITSQRFPSLRILLLRSSRMTAPQEPSLYAQLRKLTLCECPPILSLDGFLDALAASVQLEELILQGVLHRLAGEWPQGDLVPHRPPVSLPRLRNFRFYEYQIDRLSYFLAHLHLPPSAIHRIRSEVSRLRGAAKTIHAMLPPNRSATLPVLSLATDIDMTIFGSQYSIGCPRAAPSHQVEPPARDSPRVLLELTRGSFGGGWDRSMAQGLGDLVEAFGSSPLTHLTVDGDQSYSTAAAWERVFRTFPLLEELDLEGRRTCSNVRDVFRGLHAASAPHTEPEPEPDRGSESGCPVVACPNLREIWLAGDASPATYKAMRECLRYRGSRGVVLESLKMKSLAHCDRDEDEDEGDVYSYGVDNWSSRREFIEGVSDVVKSIDAGMMSDLEAEYQELGIDSDV